MHVYCIVRDTRLTRCKTLNTIFDILRFHNMNLNKKTRIFFAVAMVWGSFSPAAFAQNKQLKVNVADMDIQAGYIGRRLPLQYDNKPAVSIAEVTYSPVNNIPDDALPADINGFDILMGKDRKEPLLWCVFLPILMQQMAAFKKFKR